MDAFLEIWFLTKHLYEQYYNYDTVSNVEKKKIFVDVPCVSRCKSGRPIEVKVTLLIESITDVSEVNMDLTTTFVIYQTWTDPRLKVTSDSIPLKRN